MQDALSLAKQAAPLLAAERLKVAADPVCTQEEVEAPHTCCTVK